MTSQSALAKLPYRGIVALHFVDQRAYGGVIAKICDKGDGVESTGISTLKQLELTRQKWLVYTDNCQHGSYQ